RWVWASAALATVDGARGTRFRSFGPCALAPPSERCVEGPLSLEGLLGWHRSWAAYATGLAAEAPVSFGRSIFTPDEYAHMADVRAVFRGAELTALLALVVAGFRVVRARGRGGALRLARARPLVG